MFDRRGAAIRQAFFSQDAVNVLKIGRSGGEPVIGLTHHSLAGTANRHDGEVVLFGQGKRAGIQHVSEFGIFFLQHAGAGTRGGVQFLQVNAQFRIDLHDGLIQFRAGAFRDTAGEKGIFHGLVLTRLNKR